MSERDPRTEPKAGDILRFRNDRERRVLAVDDQWYASGLGGKVVLYIDVRKNGPVGNLRCSLAAWRKWAHRPATVVIKTSK